MPNLVDVFHFLLLLLFLRILTIFEFSTLVCIIYNILVSFARRTHRKVDKHFVRTSTSTTFIQFARNEYANGVTSENSVFGKLEIVESRTWNYIVSAMCAHCVPYVFSTGCSIYAWKCHRKSRAMYILYMYISIFGCDEFSQHTKEFGGQLVREHKRAHTSECVTVMMKSVGLCTRHTDFFMKQPSSYCIMLSSTFGYHLLKMSM